MEKVDLELTLLPAPDDGEWHNPEFQSVIERFRVDLRSQNIHAAAQGVHVASDDLTGNFIIGLAHLAVAGLTAVVVAWVHARAGRKIKLKIGEFQVEAHTEEQVIALFKQVAALKGNPSLKRGKKK
jgi:hypothetical protein